MIERGTRVRVKGGKRSKTYTVRGTFTTKSGAKGYWIYDGGWVRPYRAKEVTPY